MGTFTSDTTNYAGEALQWSIMDVGIRELRAGLSRYVERVKQGEEIVVTEHGKAVARLVPMNGERKIDRLIREGVVTPARSRTGWRPETLIPVKGSVSDIVIEQRD
jgi:prevent-host-death family protein